MATLPSETRCRGTGECALQIVAIDLLCGTNGSFCFDSIIGFSPPASMITDPNDPTFLAGQSLAIHATDFTQEDPSFVATLPEFTFLDCCFKKQRDLRQ